MNPVQISIYMDLLDGMSQSDFDSLRSRVLSERVRFRSLEVGELVCPIAEEVRERSLCSSCPLTASCPNFKL